MTKLENRLTGICERFLAKFFLIFKTKKLLFNPIRTDTDSILYSGLLFFHLGIAC